MAESIKDLANEFSQFRRNRHRERKWAVLNAKGDWYLDKLDDDEFNAIVQASTNLLKGDLELKLRDVAIRSEIPLALWLVDNLPTNYAFHVFKRLPLYAEEVDALAARSNWCDNRYLEYRRMAIESGSLLER